MNFARKQLEKYGWKPGEGLGKNKTGISTALKPKLKNDKFGLGHDISEEFTYKWWEHSFNSAANRITVSNKEDGVKVKTKKNTKPTEITTKRPCSFISKEDKHTLTYGTFKKTSRLVSEGTEERLDPDEHSEPNPVEMIEQISDEQLFIACGGRTAHKAARHNSRLSGKLARLEKQNEGVLLLQSDAKTAKKVTHLQDIAPKRLKKKKRCKH